MSDWSFMSDVDDDEKKHNDWSFMSSVGRVGKEALAGVAETAGMLADNIPTLITGNAAVGEAVRHVIGNPGSEIAAQAIKQKNLSPKPRSKGEAYAQSIGRNLGRAAIPVVGAETTLPRIAAEVLGVGVGAGVGGQGASDAAEAAGAGETGQEVARFFGELLGGGLGGAGAGAAVRGEERLPVLRGRAHPDHETLVDTVLGLEGGGTLEHPKTSPKGALGPMQVMSETAKKPGYGIKPWDGKSQEDLARVGRDYLAAMTTKYDGDTAKILAAYNGGPGMVDKLVRKYGDNWWQHLNSETAKYVANGLGKHERIKAGEQTARPMDPAEIADIMNDPEAAGLPSKLRDDTVLSPEDVTSLADEAPDNVVDFASARQQKLGNEYDQAIAENLDFADRIHKGIDLGMITEAHAPNIELARDNLLQILDDGEGQLNKAQVVGINNNIAMLDEALQRLGKGSDTVHAIGDSTSDIVGKGEKKEPVNDINQADAEDRIGVYGPVLERAQKALDSDSLPPEAKTRLQTVIDTIKNLIKDESGSYRDPDIPQDPVYPPSIERLGEALRRAQPARVKQNKLMSEERSNRMQEVAKRRQFTSGPGGFLAEKSALKGELPKESMEPLSGITSDDLVEMFDHVKNHPNLTMFQSIAAREGLAKMLQGQVPTQTEIRLLARTMPPEIMRSLLENRGRLAKYADHAANVLNIPKTLMASFDLSAPLRQGAFFITRGAFWKNLGPMVKAFASPKYEAAARQAIYEDKLFPVMEQAGLAIPKFKDHVGNLAAAEEPYMTNLAQRIPLVGIGVKASERAYTTFLYKMRADAFRSIYRAGKAAGKQWDDQSFKSLATMINSMTGRGKLPGKFDSNAPILNAVFFSPRLLKSRIDAVNPMFYAKMDPFVRKEALKSILGFTAVAGTVLGLAKLSGAEVSGDISKADGWKIKVGNTRYDILAGEQQLIRLLTNVAKYSTDAGSQLITTGKIKPSHKADSAVDSIGQFLRNKESPDISFAHDFLRGSNAVGNDFKLSDEALSRLTPLVMSDMHDIAKDKGAVGIVQAFPGIFGVGVQTYQKKERQGKVPADWKFAGAGGATDWSFMNEKQEGF